MESHGADAGGAGGAGAHKQGVAADLRIGVGERLHRICDIGGGWGSGFDVRAKRGRTSGFNMELVGTRSGGGCTSSCYCNRDAPAAAALFPAHSCMLLRCIRNEEPWLSGCPPICCTMQLQAGLLQCQTAHSLCRLPPHHAPRAALVVAPSNPPGCGGPAGWNCVGCTHVC